MATVAPTTLRVYKYPLVLTEVTVHQMSKDAKILHVDSQGGVVTMWAMFSESAPLEARRFHIVGTGHELPKDIAIEHVGSCVSGPFVWHVFEEVDPITQFAKHLF